MDHPPSYLMWCRMTSPARRGLKLMLAFGLLLVPAVLLTSYRLLPAIWVPGSDKPLIALPERLQLEPPSPIEQRCPVYQEFRLVDFASPALRDRLCQGAEAYRLYDDGYPLCVLNDPFPELLLSVVKQRSENVTLLDFRGTATSILVYKGDEFISKAIRDTKYWEPELVRLLLKLALRISNATFVDIGCNVGVYSIQAARLGLPVLAVDANIRNLLRLHLSLRASSLSATLVWNFICPGQQLRYLSFPSDCNVGASGKSWRTGRTQREELEDTVPVMPVRSERLGRLIKTKNVVMKMDIERGEADFLESSGRLFSEFSIAAVQMEWLGDLVSERDRSKILEFFGRRGYGAWRLPSLQQMNVSQWRTWGYIEILWLRGDFRKALVSKQ